MKHASLFSGIGGFDLAAEWMGWENVFHCEINPFGQKILNHYWPNSICYEDIKKTDFTIHRGTIDVLTGGFPCQPYSLAGLRKGKDDERHLWPEMLRAIREIKPTWIVGENVLGLISWNGGLVFEEVQADLEAEGYEVQPYVLPAASVGAPHRRDRVWFVAYNNSNIRRSEEWKFSSQQEQRRHMSKVQAFTSERLSSNPNGIDEKQRESEVGGLRFESSGIGNDVANTCSERCDNRCNNRQERSIQENKGITPENKPEWEGWKCRSGKIGSIITNASITSSRWELLKGQEEREFRGCDCIHHAPNSFSFGLRRQSYWIGKPRFFNQKSEGDYWQNFPTQSPICDGDDGFSSKLDGITFPKWRNESIKAGGNAIVPQVVYQIFKAIEMYEP